MPESHAVRDETTRLIMNILDEQLNEENVNDWQNSTVLSMLFQCNKNAGRASDMTAREHDNNLSEHSKHVLEIDGDRSHESLVDMVDMDLSNERRQLPSQREKGQLEVSAEVQDISDSKRQVSPSPKGTENDMHQQ